MECLSNNNPDGASAECISIYGSSSSSKKVCNTAINMCKTIDCHYENLAVLPGYSYAETCVSAAGNLADACSGSTERTALCNYGTNSCYYYNTSCSGSAPACAVDGDGRAVCVECASDANCGYNAGNIKRKCKCPEAGCTAVAPLLPDYTCTDPLACPNTDECNVNYCCEKDINKDANGDGDTNDCVGTGSIRQPYLFP